MKEVNLLRRYMLSGSLSPVFPAGRKLKEHRPTRGGTLAARDRWQWFPMSTSD